MKRVPLFQAKYSDDSFEFFEAENKEIATQIAESRLQDEASGFLGEKGVELLEVIKTTLSPTLK